MPAIKATILQAAEPDRVKPPPFSLPRDAGIAHRLTIPLGWLRYGLHDDDYLLRDLGWHRMPHAVLRHAGYGGIVTDATKYS